MLKKIWLILSFLVFSNVAFACKDRNAILLKDNISKWLGDNSNFSKAYILGKCSLDEALEDLPDAQKKVIASLIAKSYKAVNKKVIKIPNTYNY